jgi:hypothetical protein
VTEPAFELFDVPEPTPAVQAEPPITPEQVQSLRQAFDSAGITSMEERQQIIESCTIRSVANIRELLARDVRPILDRIEQRKNSGGPASGTAWDNREEDTWIDKL